MCTPSITTRIKTAFLNLITMAILVCVHHPLQQGLRLLRPVVVLSAVTFVCVHHPLQQGLRLKFVELVRIFLCVCVHHPLQQGLRPICLFAWIFPALYVYTIHYNKD